MCKKSVQALLLDLKACIRTKDLQRGKQVHGEAVACGHGSNIKVLSTLIRMYARCGSMVDAAGVFDSIQKPDVISWTALLSGYAENGEGLVALDMFSRMKDSGCAPDTVTYLAALKACTSLALSGEVSGKRSCLERGRKIHAEIGSKLELYTQSKLIGMYSKCGSMVDARSVFEIVQKPDVVCWNALLLGYAENGEGHVALDMFSKMKASGCAPDFVTYLATLKACTSLAVAGEASIRKSCLEQGRQIHSEIGSKLNRCLQNALIDMYAKCNSMGDARFVFDNIQAPDVVSWNALLLGYAENGQGLVALDMFSTMKAYQYVPNAVTYVAALRACKSLALAADGTGKKNYLDWSRKIHAEVGTKLDPYIQSTLIDVYANCGSMVDARNVFDSIRNPDVVCWNALIWGYAENGEGLVALDLFSRMKASAYAPNSVTYVAALKACTSLAADGDDNGKRRCLERGREIHLEIGGKLDLYIQSALIDMYSKCGSILDARQVFDSIQKPNVVCWNALLMGYAENGQGLVALDMLSKMEASGCAPNSVTYFAALKACGLTGALAFGRKLHSEIAVFTTHIVTCLVDLYGKCGSMAEAHEVFVLHPKARDISTWNALLAGYGRFGDTDSVFKLFDAMQDEGFRPDAVTFVSMLSCCSHAGLVKKAREYFDAMERRYGVSRDVRHYNCMIDVLGRANLLNEAAGLLQKMPCNPNAVTWTALLCACCKWKNVEIGRMAFQSLVGKDERVAAAHVLMAHVYGSNGMEQEKVLETTTTSKLSGETYLWDEVGKMIRFVAGEQGPLEVEKEKRNSYVKR